MINTLKFLRFVPTVILVFACFFLLLLVIDCLYYVGWRQGDDPTLIHCIPNPKPFLFFLTFFLLLSAIPVSKHLDDMEADNIKADNLIKKKTKKSKKEKQRKDKEEEKKEEEKKEEE